LNLADARRATCANVAEGDRVLKAARMPAPAHSLDGGVDDTITAVFQQRKPFAWTDGFEPRIDATAQAVFDRFVPSRIASNQRGSRLAIFNYFIMLTAAYNVSMRKTQAKRVARLLGARGGKKTAMSRTRQERIEAARKAVQARWKKAEKALANDAMEGFQNVSFTGKMEPLTRDDLRESITQLKKWILSLEKLPESVSEETLNSALRCVRRAMQAFDLEMKPVLKLARVKGKKQ
jgi:hypothetical protein